MQTLDPTVTFLVVVLIGIAAGILFDRLAGPSWFTRQFTGSTRAMVTSALVGVAGAFVGFHLALLVAAGAGPIVALIAAVLGAGVVLFGWRAVR